MTDISLRVKKLVVPGSFALKPTAQKKKQLKKMVSRASDSIARLVSKQHLSQKWAIIWTGQLIEYVCIFFLGI